MHIALTGISGFVGTFIARELKHQGHTVTGLVRETSRRDHLGGVCDRFVTGDHADESAWPDLLADADAVIHNSVDVGALRDTANPARHLASNLLASVRFLQASAPRPFVFMSSIAVHHDMRDRWAGDIDEDHPMRPSTTYGAAKAAVEAFLWDEHFRMGRRVVAIRPSAVYGLDPTFDKTRGHEFIGPLRNNEKIARNGGGKFVHAEDVAIATVNALTNDAVNGLPVNLVDCYARWSDIAQMGKEILGSSSEIVSDSPAQPKNNFSKEIAMRLAPSPGDDRADLYMSRGHDGLRVHMRELIEAFDQA